ncbi:hypothetical protein [Proteiniclasticum sp. QWL-01]|uniref:hypothetical protein n=1 Tax=Proteiniclasticum sp. QWL-01 TaxID=3036945 RepID=UPI0024115A05|nr:hypothetical protein [Proteiniclasticum sp. QWL-01]WFF73752.1 hypothetical protein P6M73_04735 [Proteiniclasticum sp. QWL-01]
MNRKEMIQWLMAGDPAIRWQVLRDLAEARETEVEAERNRMERTGWGRALLEQQDDDGLWSGRLYVGKWVSTTYVMLQLKECGMPQNRKTALACDQLFRRGIFEDREIRYSSGQKLRDTGVTGLVLGILAWFGYEDPRVTDIAEFLVTLQQADGSWVYDDKPGAQRYACENTLLILKGLFEFQRQVDPQHAGVKLAQAKAHEFLLEQSLLRPDRPDWLRLAYPSYWHYDVLTVLDYFRAVNCRDDRLKPALSWLDSRRNREGTWNLARKHPGATFFDMEQAGTPSRLNTLRALRVLDWSNQAVAAKPDQH